MGAPQGGDPQPRGAPQTLHPTSPVPLYMCTHALLHFCTHAHLHPCSHAPVHLCTHASVHPCTCAACGSHRQTPMPGARTDRGGAQFAGCIPVPSSSSPTRLIPGCADGSQSPQPQVWPAESGFMPPSVPRDFVLSLPNSRNSLGVVGGGPRTRDPLVLPVRGWVPAGSSGCDAKRGGLRRRAGDLC